MKTTLAFFFQGLSLTWMQIEGLPTLSKWQKQSIMCIYLQVLYQYTWKAFYLRKWFCYLQFTRKILFACNFRTDLLQKKMQHTCIHLQVFNWMHVLLLFIYLFFFLSFVYIVLIAVSPFFCWISDMGSFISVHYIEISPFAAGWLFFFFEYTLATNVDPDIFLWVQSDCNA